MADLLDWARDQPLFTINEAERATGLNRASLREKLSRLVKRSDLERVERGKYTVHGDPWIYATYVETPAYLSLWSGLRYYDLTTQQPTTVQVIAARNRDDLPAIEFFYTGAMFGFGRTPYEGFDIFVADTERLLLDCLAREQVPVGQLRDLVSAVDVATATRYAERLGTKSVQKRLGYLLEDIRGETVEALRIEDRNYPRLDLSRPADGTTSSRWRIKVNTDAL